MSQRRELTHEPRLFEGISAEMQTISSKLDKLTQYMSAFQHEQRDLRTIDEENDQESERIGVSRKRSRSSGVLDQPQSLCPGFRGPTSSSFIFEVANDRLNKMGLRAEPNDHGAEASRGRPLPVYPNRQPRCAKPYSRDWGSDTLEQLGEETVVRLCEDYDASINVLYPVLDMPRILQRARLVFAQAGSSSDLGMEVGGSSNTTTDESKFEINIFKLMCAASLAFRGQADHAMAQVLYDDVDAETPVWDAMGIRGLQYLTLVVSTKSPMHTHVAEPVSDHLPRSDGTRRASFQNYRRSRATLPGDGPEPA